MNILILTVLLLSAVSGFVTAMLSLQFILLTTEKGHHNLRMQFLELEKSRGGQRLGRTGCIIFAVVGNMTAWVILVFIAYSEMMVTDNLPTVFLIAHAITWYCMVRHFKWWNSEVFGFASIST